MEIALAILILWLVFGALGSKKRRREVKRARKKTRKKYNHAKSANRARINGKKTYLAVMRTQKRRGRFN